MNHAHVKLHKEQLLINVCGFKPIEKLYHLEMMLIFTDPMWEPIGIRQEYVEGLKQAIEVVKEEVADYILLEHDENMG